MNLKVRFALLFTLFVAVILSISLASIYVLYYNYREEDFYKRVKKEGLNYYELVLNTESAEQEVLRMIDLQSTNVLFDEQIFILDSTGKIKFKNNTTAKYNVDADILSQVKKSNGEYRFAWDERECVVMYMPMTKMYIVSSAYDKFGIAKVKNLRLILVGVLAGGLIVTGFLSFFYVKQTMKPLTNLAYQMQLITDQNLKSRVIVKPNKDEFELIALSFNEMLDRLEKAFDMQKSFVHHASHELRTPLAIMLSQTEAALGRELSIDGYKKVLVSLKEDQQELIDLTNSLLLLSQYEQLTLDARWPKVRIDELLYETVETVNTIYPNTSIDFEFVNLPDNEEHLMVAANEALLRSAIRNLVKNACQYTYDTRVAIKLDAGEDYLKLIIENKGNQLTQKEQEKLFVPFFRGENAVAKKGYGLGLSIVNRIVQLHKGHVAYETALPDINRFILTFNK